MFRIKHRVKLFALAIICLFASMMVVDHSVQAAAPSYNYSAWGDTVAAPAAYQATTVISGDSIGAGVFKEPSDFSIADDQTMYLLDSGNNRIVITDKNFKLIKIIESFTHDGSSDKFQNPQGIFVTEEKHIYIADMGNKRIVHLDENGILVKVVQAPSSDLLTKTFEFKPAKIVVDNAQRMYVMSIGVFDGFMEFNADGTFTTFFGANRVSVDPIEYFWKMLSTRAQKSQMVQFTPTEFTNLDIDEGGFVYATNGDRFGDNVKKLNAQGTDILRREGYFSPGGDPYYYRLDGPPRLIDINVTDSGMYSVLDATKGRVLTYNSDGYLLYVFGGIGNRVGEFQTPIAIERLGDHILVLDKSLGEITIFETTEYGRILNDAVRSYYRGDEEKSAALFNRAANLNANLDYAYNGIGKALLRQGGFKDAMRNFDQSMDRKNYSKAFVLHRKEVLRQYFPTLMTVSVIIVLVFMVARRYLRKTGRKKVVPIE